MDDLPATPIRSPRSPGKKLTLAEDEVARLRARLEEEEAWQAKILKRLEAKAAEDKKNESKYESTARALDDCAADLEASRQRCAVLDDDNASLRDELSAAHDRAADAGSPPGVDVLWFVRRRGGVRLGKGNEGSLFIRRETCHSLGTFRRVPRNFVAELEARR